MPRSFPQLLALLGFLAICMPRAVATDDPKAAVLPSDPIFEALRIDGQTVRGRLAELRFEEGEGQATLVNEDEEALVLEFSSLVKLTREGVAPPYPPEGSLLILPEGDRLRAIINEADQVEVETLPFALGDESVSIPLDRVLGLVLAPPEEPGALEKLIQRIGLEPRDDEVLWLANGDRLTGRFLGLDAKSVNFDTGQGEDSLGRSGIIAIGLDPTLIAYPDLDSAFLEFGLNDGSRIGLTSCQLEKGQITAKTRLGPTIQLPLKELARVQVVGGALDYLDGRSPERAVYVPYLDHHPESFGRNTTWDGHPLTMGGQPFDRGLGMLPRTLLAYAIQPGDARFQALVGLDDRAGDQASVVFRVLVDRREAFQSPTMTPQSEPIAVDVDLEGGQFLILTVEFGDRGDVQDSADWIEARIIRP